MKLNVTLIALLAMGLRATAADPPPKFPIDTEKFAKRASTATEITLDKNMLEFAAKFLSSSKEDQEGRRIIANLDGIYVRTYAFAHPGEYSAAEIDALRQPFQAAEWSHIVSVRAKGGDGDTDVYIDVKDGRAKGMVVIATQPTELTFVNIAGQIKAEDLAELSGHFGIPVVHDKGQEPKKDSGK
jgi:hypothetical protein